MGSNRVLIKPVQTGDRIIDQWNRETLLQQGDVYSRIETLETPVARVMPLDMYTDLWWPCDDAIGLATIRNIGNYKATGDNLVGGTTCVASLGGFVTQRCRRLYGADATRGASGATGQTGSTPRSVTISCWVRFSDSTGGLATFLFGYVNAASTVTSIALGLTAAALPYVQVESLAGGRATIGVSDMKMSDGVWHFLAGSYNGTSLVLYVDGIAAGSSYASSEINWALASTPAWRLGLVPTTTSMRGLIQDCRMHSAIRSGEWCDEAWRRGMNIYGR